MNFPDYGGNTALHFAAHLNDTKAASILLKHGASIDAQARGNFHLTPLLVAAQWSNPEMLALLIENGANWKATDSQGKNGLQLSETCCGDGLGELTVPLLRPS